METTPRKHLTWQNYICVGFVWLITALLAFFIANTIIYSYKDFSFEVSETYIEPTFLAAGQDYIKPGAVVKGTIYLTFDDGPGDYTAELLDVLQKYKIKATFFVTGKGDDSLIAREYNDGHAIGLHTCSHNYSYVYANMDNFFADLNCVQNRVVNITGQPTNLIRFPGGSSNTVSRRYDKGSRIMSKLTREVENRGFAYFDWNVDSDDAGRARSAEEVYNNVTSRLKDGDNVILQHDIKPYSVAAVEHIIIYGLENNYKFDKLSPSSYSAHHGVNN